MKVAFVSQWRKPGSLSVSTGIAFALAQDGADVTSFAGRFALDGTRHGPRRGLRHSYPWVGGHVTTYPGYYSHDSSTFGRVLSYGSHAVISALASSDLRDFDVTLVYATPATVAASAMSARLRYGVPYVLFVQDVWPDSVFATGFLTGGIAGRLARGTLGAFVDSAYRHAAAVIAISPGMRSLLISRGVPSNKMHHVYNWVPDDSDIRPVTVPDRQSGEPLHLMYAGALGFAQNLDNVLSSLALMPHGTTRLTLVGDGPAVASLRQLATDLGLSNVEFIGRVPRDQVPALQSTAHLHLISLADQELFRITIPSKLQALAAHGAPILCTAPGEAAELVTSNQMGLSAPPGDPHQLAAVIQQAAELSGDQLRVMGANGQALYRREMSRGIGAKKLADILRSAAEGARHRR